MNAKEFFEAHGTDIVPLMLAGEQFDGFLKRSVVLYKERYRKSLPVDFRSRGVLFYSDYLTYRQV